MATPTKDAITEHALHIFQQRNHHISCNTPEEHELKESGVWLEARDDLMRSRESEAIDYLEKLAHENGFELVKSKHSKEYSDDLNPYPLEDIMKKGAFCVGTRGVGKTNLIKILTMKALERKIRVKVIDACLAWKNYPLLPSVRVKRNIATSDTWNMIYDVSRLSILEIRDYASKMMAKDTQEAIISTDQGFKDRCLYVLEEVQNVILPNSLRTLKFQEISRCVTQGRNFNLSYLYSTQRLASTDTTLVEVSGVKFWFKSEGENTLKKARAWLPKFVTWRLRDLNVGTCYLQIGSKVKFLTLPLFEAQRVVA